MAVWNADFAKTWAFAHVLWQKPILLSTHFLLSSHWFALVTCLNLFAFHMIFAETKPCVDFKSHFWKSFWFRKRRILIVWTILRSVSIPRDPGSCGWKSASSWLFFSDSVFNGYPRFLKCDFQKTLSCLCALKPSSEYEPSSVFAKNLCLWKHSLSFLKYHVLLIWEMHPIWKFITLQIGTRMIFGFFFGKTPVGLLREFGFRNVSNCFCSKLKTYLFAHRSLLCATCFLSFTSTTDCWTRIWAEPLRSYLRTICIGVSSL